MGLRMHIDSERILGAVHFDRRQEGAPGFAHGGAVATVLEDALGTVLLMVGRPAVIDNLSIGYRAPALLDRDLTIEAWRDRIDGRELVLAARLLDGGLVIAEARGLFIEVDLDNSAGAGSRRPRRGND